MKTDFPGKSSLPRKYPSSPAAFLTPANKNLALIHLSNPILLILTTTTTTTTTTFQSPMFAKNYDFSRAVVEMAWIMLRIDYSRLFWILFGVFSYENHEGKPRI